MDRACRLNPNGLPPVLLDRHRRSFNMEADLSNFVPYKEDLEPLATEEEAAEQDARMAEELEEELRYQARFDREVDVNTWYNHWTVFV